MREIKFRAWCDRELKYYYFGFGDLYCHDDSVSIGKNRGEAKCLNHLLHGINPRLSIEQYTGLKDKNGKEIYEGDVDLCTDANGDKWRGIITWNNESADYELLNKFHGFQRAFGIIGDEHEVVGNIYENPELLK